MTQNIILQSIVYIWWWVCWPPSLLNFHLRRSNIFNTYHIRVTVLDLIVRVAFIYVHGIDQPKNKWPGTFCAGPAFFPWVVLRNNFVSRGRGGGIWPISGTLLSSCDGWNSLTRPPAWPPLRSLWLWNWNFYKLTWHNI